jgi:adenylate cyclase
VAFLRIDDKTTPTQGIHPCGDEPVTLGRGRENTIMLRSTYVSGRHARVRRGDDGGFLVEDLGSHNGTFLNGMRVRRASLLDGDCISIADSQITFVDRPAGRVVIHDDSDEGTDENRFVRLAPGEAPMVRSLADKAPAMELATSGVRASPVDPRMLFLFQAGERIHAATSPRQLATSLLELLVEAIPCERAYVLLLAQDGEWIPLAVAEDGELVERERLTLSQSITSRAISEGTGVMVGDAQADLRFDPSRSIVSLGIRSAMGAPLWTGDRVIGLIYMDDRVHPDAFKWGQLDLLTALGHHAAMGFERLQLQQEVRRQERQRLELQRYHSPEVVDWILGSDGGETKLEAAEMEVTILFADIVGFTSIAESMPPLELATFLNEVLSLLTEVVFELQGTLDKYLGDGIMAVFGAPVTREDDAHRAVQAGLRMSEELAGRLSPPHRAIQPVIRVGINSGTVLAGNLGSHRRVEYTVLGDAVNVAQRLERECTPGEVLVSEGTWRAVEGRFHGELVGERSVKNRQKPVICYRVLREK